MPCTLPLSNGMVEKLISPIFYIDPWDNPQLMPILDEVISLTVGFGKWVIPILLKELELPKAMFVGTPTNMNIEKLEKPLGKPIVPFLAPKGVTNVALGKSVTSTDDMPIIGDVEYITDGDKDADEGYFVELGRYLGSIGFWYSSRIRFFGVNRSLY